MRGMGFSGARKNDETVGKRLEPLDFRALQSRHEGVVTQQKELAMRPVLVNLMCHPVRDPKITVPDGEGYTVFMNRRPNYAAAFVYAMKTAVDKWMDMVIADTDGYHPVEEIVKLARYPMPEKGMMLVKPFRENIGFQSDFFSMIYSTSVGRRVKDSTGGMYKMSYDLMKGLGPLQASDMTIHIEILNRALSLGAKVVQYGYTAGLNDRKNSKRTSQYQLKLLRELAMDKIRKEPT